MTLLDIVGVSIIVLMLSGFILVCVAIKIMINPSRKNWDRD